MIKIMGQCWVTSERIKKEKKWPRVIRQTIERDTRTFLLLECGHYLSLDLPRPKHHIEHCYQCETGRARLPDVIYGMTVKEIGPIEPYAPKAKGHGKAHTH